MILFYYKNMILGGAELLIIRLCKALKNAGESCLIVSEKISDDIIWQLKDNNIEYLICEKSDYRIYGLAKEYNKIKILTLFYVDYIHVRYLLRNQRHVKIVLYCVHINGMIFGRPIPKQIKNRFLKASRDFIMEGIDNKSIFFMDKETVENTYDYYGISETKTVDPIGLPYDFVRSESDVLHDIDCRFDNKIMNIITVARADFPFKGYLIGLISKYVLFHKQHPYSVLHIVASGKDSSRIIQAIKEAPEEIQHNIVFHGKVKPQELNIMLKYMDVLIGMGTTMLDASSHGVISIPVVPGTMRCLCSEDFFYQNLLFSVRPEYSIDNINDLLDKLYYMSNEEYKQASLYSYKIPKSIFSTESIIGKLFEDESLIVDNRNINYLNFYVKIDKFWKRVKGIIGG